MTASDTIRAIVEALPEYQRAAPWLSQGELVGTAPSMADVCQTWEPDENAPTADYIALMDPTVGLALADLLDAIRDRTEAVLDEDRTHASIAAIHIHRAATALEAAITREHT